MSQTYTLYTTQACHLCESAKVLLWPALDARGWQLREVDIAEGEDSDQLIETYGVRIPVVAAPSGIELGWPFDALQLAEWLDAQA
ncbi:glutaredoxin family protein [Marinimicrobium alkaliphilum]|uniref:glutaredoxin family protein n=1 Tax=Marinimicrobium alkaliphilum TaxID=2202654 RepID=UPI000DBAC27C|nr:glutaredoxin family protein [Marinimicrobium alkaliphilum]